MSEATEPTEMKAYRIGVPNKSYVRLRTNDEAAPAKVARALGKGAVVRTKGEDGKWHAA